MIVSRPATGGISGGSLSILSIVLLYISAPSHVDCRPNADAVVAYDSICGAQALEPMAVGCCAGNSSVSYMFTCKQTKSEGECNDIGACSWLSGLGAICEYGKEAPGIELSEAEKQTPSPLAITIEECDDCFECNPQGSKCIPIPGCGDDSMACTSDLDCTRLQSCNDKGICVLAGDHFCSNDEDCENNQKCTDHGVCVIPDVTTPAPTYPCPPPGCCYATDRGVDGWAMCEEIPDKMYCKKQRTTACAWLEVEEVIIETTLPITKGCCYPSDPEIMGSSKCHEIGPAEQKCKEARDIGCAFREGEYTVCEASNPNSLSESEDSDNAADNDSETEPTEKT